MQESLEIKQIVFIGVVTMYDLINKFFGGEGKISRVGSRFGSYEQILEIFQWFQIQLGLFVVCKILFLVVWIQDGVFGKKLVWFIDASQVYRFFFFVDFN